MEFNPTAEQQAIIDAFLTGGSLVIEAGAGTGKTSTLRMLAQSTPKRGLYIAYNRAIKDDAAASFPSNVKCQTAHGLAYGQIVVRNDWMKRRLNANRMPSRQIVGILGIPAGGFVVNDEATLQPWVIARLASQAVDRFCYSADADITVKHVPYTTGIDGADHDALAAFVLPFAQRVWADLNDPNGKLKLTHDAYLKMWALTGPKLRYDFIMLDEAQDANPVIAQIVEGQDCQQIMVGDRCQAIYGWRGAIDAMTAFEADHRLVLSQSFRFGAAVAEQANKWLDLLAAPLRLSGFDKLPSKVVDLTDADAILCRTNAEVVAQAMAAQATGKRVAIVGGTKEIERFAKGADDLMRTGKSTHEDLIAFTDWADVIKYAEEEATDLKVMVNLINNYGVATVLEVCANSVDESGADLIVSTAHKAKGREWDRVRIGDDFYKDPTDNIAVSPAEMMLCYVSVTRARLELDCSALSWVDLI